MRGKCTSPVLPVSLLFPLVVTSTFPRMGDNMRGPSVMDVCEDIGEGYLMLLFICRMEGRTYIVGYAEVGAKHRMVD